MSHFPIVLMPTKMQRIQQELPPIRPLTDRPPVYPGAEPQPPSFGRTLIEALVFSIGSSLIYRFSAIAGVVLFIIGLGILSVYQYQRVKSYRKQSHGYNLVLEAYYKSLDIYARKQARHETDIALAHSSAKLLEYRRPKLLEFLGSAIPHGNMTNKVAQGQVERNFAQVLLEYFPDQIHMGWQIKLSNSIFSPNFAYIDLDTNLHIAIEVDEQQDRHTQESTLGSTHSLENLKSSGDRGYNQNLLDAGWIVMRFSESQVKRSPHSCCKAIATLLDRLWGLPQLMQKFADVPELDMEPQQNN
jgi:hypothetical protein